MWVFKLSENVEGMVGLVQLPDYEASDDFHSRWKSKARQVLTDIEWRRRKITLRVRTPSARVSAEPALGLFAEMERG